jgi:plastocyanin
MKKNNAPMYYVARLVMTTVTCLAMISTVHADTHIIRFGDELGYVYSPSTLYVAIGDSVRWEGEFSSHPLSSTSVPPGALGFHNEAGTVFTYFVEVEGVYNYRCDTHHSSGMTGSFASTITGIDERQSNTAPVVYQLENNYPNPFNPSTSIGFQLPAEEHVEMRIYNLLGQEVRTLINERRTAGSHRVVWDGRDENGELVASGMYIYQIKAEGFVSARTMLLVR